MTTQDLFNRAAGELPEGFMISVDVENGFGGARLIGPGENEIEFDQDGTIEEQVINAIQKAREVSGL